MTAYPGLVKPITIVNVYVLYGHKLPLVSAHTSAADAIQEIADNTEGDLFPGYTYARTIIEDAAGLRSVDLELAGRRAWEEDRAEHAERFGMRSIRA